MTFFSRKQKEVGILNRRCEYRGNRPLISETFEGFGNRHFRIITVWVGYTYKYDLNTQK